MYLGVKKRVSFKLDNHIVLFSRPNHKQSCNGGCWFTFGSSYFPYAMFQLELNLQRSLKVVQTVTSHVQQTIKQSSKRPGEAGENLNAIPPIMGKPFQDEKGNVRNHAVNCVFLEQALLVLYRIERRKAADRSPQPSRRSRLKW